MSKSISNKSEFFTEIKPINNVARVGKLQFENVFITTPTFMPVGTRGTVKGLTMEQVSYTGAGIVLGNTYHLHLAPGEDSVAAMGGLGKMIGWNGPTLTDSGGFQVFSLGRINNITDDGVEFQNPINGNKVLLTPEKSIQIQHKIGADIIMAFDDVVSLTTESRTRTLDAMKRTHQWLDRSIVEHKRLMKLKVKSSKLKDGSKFPKLFGIAQGGIDKRMRKQSLDYVQNTEVDGIAIGGLSVGETRKEMHEMLEYLVPMYDEKRPRYLMGVGHPIDLRFGIEHGIDMFDCVLPTRNGRHGTIWINEGGKDEQVNLKREQYSNDYDPLPGDSYTSQKGYSKAYLKHLIKSGESLGGTLLSIHNLRYLQAICEEYQGETIEN